MISWNATNGDSTHRPKVACLCPTYKRPRELANVIECFLRQDYPAELRELIVLDDAGQYVPDAITTPGVKLITTPHRFRTLGEKRNASAALSSPDAVIYSVWDDDDVYLPWHISAAVAALEQTGADYTIPTALYTENRKRLAPKSNGQMFHGAWAFRRAAFERVGGYPWIQSGQDQGLLRRFKAASLRRADPIRFDPRPSYIYRWGTTPCGWHISGLNRQDGYERVAAKQGESIQQLTPALEKDWTELTAQFREPDARKANIPFSVVVPCRELDEPRARAWEWVRKKIVEAFPNAEIVPSDDGGTGDTPFNRSRAIMNGVARASHDILVITDADVWSYGLLDAIEAVAAGAPWATPHGRIHRLTRSVTERLYAGHYPTPRSACERPPYAGNLGGGLVVVAQRTLEQVPFDCRFTGWGREDDAWQMAVKCLLPGGVRFDHPLYHLWHPPQPSSADRKRSPNQQLFARYRAVANSRAAMQSLLVEAGMQPI
jgi:hypothetical protein